MAISTATYVATLTGGRYLARHEAVHGAAVWLLAIVPGLAVMGMIYASVMRIIEQEDEYLRMLSIRQFMVATGITLSLITICGFFQEFGLVGPIELYWVFVLWCFSLPIGMLFNRLTAGSWGDIW